MARRQAYSGTWENLVDEEGCRVILVRRLLGWAGALRRHRRQGRPPPTEDEMPMDPDTLKGWTKIAD